MRTDESFLYKALIDSHDRSGIKLFGEGRRSYTKMVMFAKVAFVHSFNLGKKATEFIEKRQLNPNTSVQGSFVE